MIRIKDKTVNLVKLDPVMYRAIVYADDLFIKYKCDTVITSGNDGKHMAGSKHYENRAVDFRTFHLPDGYQGLAAQDITTRLLAQLKPIGFDVVLEKDHLHVEYDPK